VNLAAAFGAPIFQVPPATEAAYQRFKKAALVPNGKSPYLTLPKDKIEAPVDRPPWTVPGGGKTTEGSAKDLVNAISKTSEGKAGIQRLESGANLELEKFYRYNPTWFTHEGAEKRLTDPSAGLDVAEDLPEILEIERQPPGDAMGYYHELRWKYFLKGGIPLLLTATAAGIIYVDGLSADVRVPMGGNTLEQPFVGRTAGHIDVRRNAIPKDVPDSVFQSLGSIPIPLSWVGVTPAVNPYFDALTINIQYIKVKPAGPSDIGTSVYAPGPGPGRPAEFRVMLNLDVTKLIHLTALDRR
jgi:hypothetical protein